VAKRDIGGRGKSSHADNACGFMKFAALQNRGGIQGRQMPLSRVRMSVGEGENHGKNTKNSECDEDPLHRIALVSFDSVEARYGFLRPRKLGVFRHD
jgi:hypothetical protein